MGGGGGEPPEVAKIFGNSNSIAWCTSMEERSVFVSHRTSCRHKCIIDYRLCYIHIYIYMIFYYIYICFFHIPF